MKKVIVFFFVLIIGTIMTQAKTKTAVSIIGADTYCSAEGFVTLYLQISGNPVAYLWSTGDTTREIHVSPKETTTYSVTVTFKSSEKATAEKTISVTPLPETGNIIGPSVVIKGDTAEFSADVKEGVEYIWVVSRELTIVSGQGTAKLIVCFGDSGGTIDLIARNSCGYSEIIKRKLILLRSVP